MQLVTKYPQACFSWIDLATTDATAAKSFYSALFGWSALDLPLPMGGVYSMMQIDGHDVCGLSQMSPEQAQAMPPVWNSYINVDNLEEATNRAAAAGATIIAPPFDVMDSGQMSVIQDPTGAVVSFWQAKNHIGSEVVNQPNSLVWNELATRDVNAARAFYGDVLGWDYQYSKEGNYHMFVNKGRMAAGMIEMNEQWAGMPPHWMVYFLVEDAQATADKAAGLGGTVSVPPTEIPGTGTFTVIQDPQGAVFTAMKMLQVDPPPGH